MTAPKTELSVLDLAPVPQGFTPADALRNTLDLAQHAEAWGYRRYWVAEHHNMVGIASAATSVVIGYIAGGTRTIRVGAGGIMLPNHSPLVIAEQFGTLASLYPGRIDLGLGRAPGTDQRTLLALRRDPGSSDDFPQDVLELQALLGPVQPGQFLQAVPGAGTNVPLWILGSSLFGAQLAAMLGLPYAFASHFAPDALMQALQIYREQLQTVGAARQALRHDRRQCHRRRHRRGGPPALHLAAAGLHQHASRDARAAPAADRRHRVLLVAVGKDPGVEHAPCSVVGSRQTVRDGLARLIEQTGADELMVAAAIYDHGARLRSYEILAEAWKDLS